MSTITQSNANNFVHAIQNFRDADTNSAAIAARVKQIKSGWNDNEKALRAELAMERWVGLIRIVERAAA